MLYVLETLQKRLLGLVQPLVSLLHLALQILAETYYALKPPFEVGDLGLGLVDFGQVLLFEVLQGESQHLDLLHHLSDRLGPHLSA